jgi:hypothetical protein
VTAAVLIRSQTPLPLTAWTLDGPTGYLHTEEIEIHRT